MSIDRSGERHKRCLTPNCNAPGTILCDYYVARGKITTTCDVRLCETCAYFSDSDKHYCKAHFAFAAVHGEYQTHTLVSS